MKTYVRALTLMVGILSMFLMGITFINWIYSESCQLFLYDFKNGFADNRTYLAALIILIFLTILGGGVYQQALFGKIHAIWTVKIKKKLYLAAFDRNDGQDIRADKRINLKIMANAVGITVIVCSLIVDSRIFYAEIPMGTWKAVKTIGHSFGAVNGDDYTGSLEAFEYNYALGRRTMEVDLILTSDHKLVLKHDWDESKEYESDRDEITQEAPLSEEQFLNTKILEKYTPMSFAQLCEIMMEYPDLWIVTDTKNTENEEVKEQFEVMAETVRQLGCEEVMDRIIVQVYNEEMYETVHSIYQFKNYIFTMYLRFENEDWLGIMRTVCRFCVNNGIETVTIGTNRISPELIAVADHYGRNVYVHTVNDMADASRYFQMGVTGIYTDIIQDKDLYGKQHGQY